MQFPESVTKIVDESVRKYGTDIAKSQEVAESKIRTLPEFPEIVDFLVTMAIQELIYRRRCETNVQIRRQIVPYTGPAKVGMSEACDKAYMSLYLYKIGDTLLGDLLGEQLADIAKSESAIASGHSRNARLCIELQEHVPEGKRVRDVVPEPTLRTLWLKASGELSQSTVRLKRVPRKIKRHRASA